MKIRSILFNFLLFLILASSAWILGVKMYMDLKEIKRQLQYEETAGSSGLWYPQSSNLRPAVSTWGIKIPALTNCDTIDTDADGIMSCGSDSTTGGVLNDIGDVTLTSTSTGDLIYLAADGDWKNIATSALGISVDLSSYMQDEDINTFAELQSWVSDETLLKAGTLTNSNLCQYYSAQDDIYCNLPVTVFVSASADSILPDYLQDDFQTDEYCLTFETGGTLEWQDCDKGNSYLELSTWFATTTHSLISSLPSLSITESQISDLQIYATQAYASTTYAIAGGAYHDGFSDFVADEHIDWTADQGATDIDAGNYTDTNTTYTGGTNLTLVDTTFNVDDAFILNTGDTGTGVYDFGGADDFEIPNGASPTVDTAGQLALDTTSDQFKYYGSAERVLFYEFDKSFAIGSTTLDKDFVSFDTGTSTFHLWNPHKAVTLTDLYCKTEDAGTVIIRCGDGTNFTESIVCTTSGAEDDGSIANGTFTAREDFLCEVGSSATAPDWATISATFNYTSD